MPFVLSKSTPKEKSKYLKDLFSKTYITDVIERNRINNDKDVLEDLSNILSSAIGSLTKPHILTHAVFHLFIFAGIPSTHSCEVLMPLMSKMLS